MTTITPTAATTSTGPRPTGAPGPLRRLLGRLADYAAYRTTVKDLEELPDAVLRDLGIPRGTIPAVARSCVYGD